jgi:hypothetical protein
MANWFFYALTSVSLWLGQAFRNFYLIVFILAILFKSVPEL